MEQSSGKRKKTGATTIRQVAERAGVHPATVSRAMQGDPRVKPATLLEIQRVAREMNFSPSVLARSLATGKTDTIAIATGSANEHYYAQILHFLEKELTASHCKRLVLGSRDLERDLAAIVNTHAVDGVIAIDSFPRIDELMRSPEAAVLPCVYAGVSHLTWTQQTRVDIVKIDLGKAARLAVQSMLDSGCQRIAYLLTSAAVSAKTESRLLEYSTTLTAAGKPLEVINLELPSFEFQPEQMRVSLRAYLEKNGCPDGLFCHNDEFAIVAQRVVRDMGFRIPKDVQIVGCDGISYLDYFEPSLSTIMQPAQEMCALAWRFLQRRMSNQSLPRQIAHLEAKLVKRESMR